MKDYEEKIEKIGQDLDRIITNILRKKNNQTKFNLEELKQLKEDIKKECNFNDNIEISNESLIKYIYELQFSQHKYDNYSEENEDWNKDYAELKEEYDIAEKNLKQAQNDISSEILVQTIEPTEITIDFLENLKSGNKEKSPVFYLALNRYAKNLKTEDVTEDKLEYLYNNEFLGEIDNKSVNFMYKLYSDGRVNHSKIEEMSGIIEKQDKIIKEDDKIINLLKDKLEFVNNKISNLKQKFSKIENSMNFAKDNILKLKDKNEKEDEKGIIKTITDKIKSLFSNQKLLPENEENKYMEAYEECFNVEKIAKEIRWDTQDYNPDSVNYEVYSKIKNREKQKSEINKNNEFIKEIYFEKEPKWEIKKDTDFER